MYTDVAVYTDQIRNLEAFTKSNPQDAASRFLLAYHYMSCGYPEAAARSVQQVVKLMPSDRVAADLLRMVSDKPPAPPEENAQPPVQQPQQATRPAVKAVDLSQVSGRWKATRSDGSTFGLTLTNDGKFIWRFEVNGKAAEEFGGSYTLEGNVLAMERKDGGSLIGEVVAGTNGKFNFKLLGAPPEDQGLDFTR